MKCLSDLYWRKHIVPGEIDYIITRRCYSKYGSRCKCFKPWWQSKIVELFFKRRSYSYWQFYNDGPECRYWEPETVFTYFIFGVAVWKYKILDNQWGEDNPQ